MKLKSQPVRILMSAFVLVSAPLLAADKERMLFDFAKPASANPWRTVNDGVMGGRSDGRFRINDDKKMEFYGTLSLRNNGGFASVRSRGAKLGLAMSDTIAIRVRGDGRKYNFNLYGPRGFGSYSYRKSFQTKKGQWIEVRFPVKSFVATYRGRFFPREKLDPRQVSGLGILLGDKKEGRFKLEVEWIKVLPATADRDSASAN